MNLNEYFENSKGIGVLSTADASGNVNAAVFARPHVMEDGQIAFIMRDRLTHRNLQSNSNAAYLFKEDGPGYKGKRLYLTKTGEEEEGERLQKLARRVYPDDQDKGKGSRFLVFYPYYSPMISISNSRETLNFSITVFFASSINAITSLALVSP